MTRRESHADIGRKARFVVLNVALACAIALSACDDGLEPERQTPASPNVDAGGRKDGGTTTTSNSATARDAGGDGAQAGGDMNADAATGGSTRGGMATGDADAGGSADGGTSSVQVAPACMGHGGETVCEGATLIRCGMAGNAESQTPCMNETLCRAGLMTGKCGSCDPGTAQCNGAELQECNTNGEFVHKQPCPSAKLCSAMNKSCNPMQCGADTVKCEDGFLKRCKPDLTGFDMGMQCMSQMLCSEADKRCNECMPNSKTCQGDNVMTCSADGKGPTPTLCSGSTPRCLGGKCVQCQSDSDCMTSEPCRVPKCNVATGMCAPEVAPRSTACTTSGTSGVCDLLGACVQCLDDSNCQSSQRCSLLATCVDRAPLELSLLGCGFTLSAGYDLNLQTISGSRTMEISGSQLIVASFRIRPTDTPSSVNPLVTSGTQTRSYSVYGAEGSASISCSARRLTDSSAEFVFTNTGNTASTVTMTISATRPRG